MDYVHIDGQVYSRYASTPPVINSSMALKYGIQGPCLVEPGSFSGFEVGRNVKLRLVIDGGSKKMTCHATIDWVKKDEDSGQWMIGFGRMSLTEEEFRILEESFVEKPHKVVEFGTSVRDKAREAVTITGTDKVKEIMRLKAVNFPVSVIEAIDENRGDTSFSEFVAKAVRAYVRK